MRERKIDREYITGAVIFICVILVFISTLSVKLLNIKISNIELVDRGLYTIVTERGPVNVSHDEILRIERTYPKAAITGAIVEQDRIYTTKGFIYLSSVDSFYESGRQLINSVDPEGNPVWIKMAKGETVESPQNWNQLLSANKEIIQPYNYAIGTPSKLISVVFAVLTIQHLALVVGCLALIILIFPLRFYSTESAQPFEQEEQEHGVLEKEPELTEMKERSEVVDAARQIT